MMKSLFTVAAFVASVNANCDNSCSGHGSCTMDDVCDCFDNWGVGLSMDSGDCSDRICPFEIAWVDSPDINGRTNRYAECAGRGICNRGSGLCECFEGYEGEACHRTTCPNLCSGHGTCEYIEDMVFMAVYADYNNVDFVQDAKTMDYPWWDRTKTRGCVCDAQYTDIDCSKRMCPYGTDILADHEWLVSDQKWEQQVLTFAPENGNLTTLMGHTFALTFVSRLNETFTTIPIVFDDPRASDTMNEFANDIRLALLHLPNQVIDNCQVFAEVLSSPSSGYPDPRVEVTVTFSGDAVQGPQNFLVVEDYECSSGCTPRITGLGLETAFRKIASNASHVDYTAPYIEPPGRRRKLQAVPADRPDGGRAIYNSYECGRRGKCDYTSGLCDCFEGYTGENCNTLTTLV